MSSPSVSHTHELAFDESSGLNCSNGGEGEGTSHSLKTGTDQ